MESFLNTLQEELKETLELTKNSTPRDYKFPEAKNMIKVAIGMRRSGKTYFIYQTIRKLVDEGLPLDRILYINFEDDRILPLDYKAMGKLVDLWYTLHPANHDHCCYLFFDEVQNVKDWALVLRRILDKKNVQIYATGSSAKLLSKEIATSLRGRSLSIEIAPYNFREYLAAHHLEVPSKSLGKKLEDQQRGYLLDYFQMGGFPGIQSLIANEQIETLQSYVETVIFRDIIERYQVGNIALLKYFTSVLLKNVSSLFSINKLYKDIKSQGHKVGKDTLYTYLSYLENAFLLFPVPIFTESLRRKQTNPQKVYAIDNGLIGANTFNLSSNQGKLLENQIYLDLRRQGKQIFYYQTSDGYEIDFITQDLHGKYEMIQVVWDIDDPKTLEREERALRRAEKELGFSGKILDLRSYCKEFF
ncbi:MAG TPA: ATP-binding protein [Rhabdochlamydiaceae bacterium]|nr:ATP-binding protein [Rhabdochlamydiaceae bacterium]